MGLNPDQYAKGRRLKHQDGDSFVVTGDRIGEFIPVAIDSDNPSSISGLLSIALLTEGESQFSPVEDTDKTDSTDRQDAPQDDRVVMVNPEGNREERVSPNAVEAMKAAKWTVKGESEERPTREGRS